MLKIYKNIKTYSFFVLLLVIVGLLIYWYIYSIREKFTNNNYPKISHPLKFVRKYIAIGDKTYKAIFVKVNTSKDKSKMVMGLQGSGGPKGPWAYADAATGRYEAPPFNITNMIYLNGTNITSSLGSKFILGNPTTDAKEGEVLTLKYDAINGQILKVN